MLRRGVHAVEVICSTVPPNGSGLPRYSPIEVNIVLLLRCYLMHARCLTKWQSVYIVIHVFSISHSVGRCSFLELLKIGLRWRITVRWISQLCIRYHTCFVCPFLCHYFCSSFGCFASERAVRGLLLELLNLSTIMTWSLDISQTCF